MNTIFFLVTAVLSGLLFNRAFKPAFNFLFKTGSFLKKQITDETAPMEDTSSIKGINELIRSFNNINTRLESEISEMELSHNHMRRVLSEIALTMTFPQDIDNILDTILNIAIKALDARKGLILTKDKNYSELTIKSAVGYDRDIIGTREVGFKEGIIGWVIENGKPVILPGEDKDQRFKKLSTVEIGNHSTICTPIIHLRKKVGAILISNKMNGKKFSSDDLIILNNLAAQTAIAMENAMLRENIENTYLETISALAIAVESKDKYTKGHSLRVGKIASSIAREMGLGKQEIEEIEYAATLHDIGKIGIMDSILHKGKLSPEEFEIIKKHPEIGENIIRPVASLNRLCPILRHHHERVDGNGYPDSLTKEEIPLASRILFVADAFDAMTSNRPYRKALCREEAIEELQRNAGYQFDRDIVENFMNCFQQPHFSQLQLN
jgi:HD-GYP domain-containing protein (c-di-GMP phosphodiesterase class II)